MPIKVNMEKAKEIHRDFIRIVRTPLLEDLDVQFMRALESGSPQDVAAISTLKQALRDEPDNPNIASSETTEDLKNQWDSGLLGDNPFIATGSPQ